MLITASRFLEALERSGICAANDWRAVREIAGRDDVPDDQSLADALVASRRLTRYQADELLAGRGRRLC